MTRKTLRFSLLALPVALAACGTPNISQYTISAPMPQARVPARVSSIEVRDVSIPRYAAADEIAVLEPDGAIRAIKDTSWADDPQRAVTMALARDLGAITGARVAAEPWPFGELPSAQLTVRVDHMLAGLDGNLRMTGQYIVAPVAVQMTDRSDRFDITIPVEEATPVAVARAQGKAVTQLAEIIARKIAR
ncbi:PqiC family protein [Qingshengfaniella alkalisoli]|uniref:Membrane integrity-associated transporter subunit PqiC n=1 Tax=Qingshengfaniella alkalisoli TaxID=2599296 RepID=A0A5B8IA83_9RHOB|nr:PqiC family protein [Qingshengfaniella alkalisoli]QDY70106.1 membrane integrity-associated transporter subunit PqiC [Qingshengfaniella alkalisoli]